MKNTYKSIKNLVNQTTNGMIDYWINNHNYKDSNKKIHKNDPLIKMYKRGMKDTLQIVKETLDKL